MKLRKNKTTPKSCQLTIDDDICLSGNSAAGWNVGDEILTRVVKGKHGNTIELMRASDIMAFMVASNKGASGPEVFEGLTADQRRQKEG